MVVEYQQVDTSTLVTAFPKVTNSNFIVDQASQVCLEDLQNIAPPPGVKPYPICITTCTCKAQGHGALSISQEMS